MMCTTEIKHEIYANLSACYNILTNIDEDPTPSLNFMYPISEWRFEPTTIKSTGIDMDEIYEFIRYIVMLRKYQLEQKLLELEK